MACKVGLIIYVVLQSVAFLFILVGTPIDQFRSKGEDMFGNTPCLTFWGGKQECYSLTYNVRNSVLWTTCSARLNRFQAAAAFSIISIAVYLVALILGFVQLCCCRCLRWFCLVLNILGVATACVSWACMVSEYYTTRETGCVRLNVNYKYGAGFALFIAGWGLCAINIVFLMLPC